MRKVWITPLGRPVLPEVYTRVGGEVRPGVGEIPVIIALAVRGAVQRHQGERPAALLELGGGVGELGAENQRPRVAVFHQHFQFRHRQAPVQRHQDQAGLGAAEQHGEELGAAVAQIGEPVAFLQAPVFAGGGCQPRGALVELGVVVAFAAFQVLQRRALRRYPGPVGEQVEHVHRVLP
jgi:hypothetical protein